MAGIYLHIPFCRKACYYCDFHFSTNLTVKDDMIAAIAKELQLQKQYLNAPVETIYFGGGTPSLLSGAEIAHLLSVVNEHFTVLSSPEITLEANPDDLNPAQLTDLRSVGVNRLSIGIQSFDNTVLKGLNRTHTAEGAQSSLEGARSAGFDNISIDLIYAIPGQARLQWEENVNKALALSPEHLSAYSLTVEERTVFGRWAARGKFTSVPDDESATQLETLITMLENNGYEQYEVSNFAKPGFQSKHNSSYWKQAHYLGVGPSAHSFNGISRQWNISNNHQYLRSLAEGVVPSTTETLEIRDRINDFLLTTLRTSWGCDLAVLRNELGYDLMKGSATYVTSLLENGMAILEKENLKLTRKGRFLADKISADLFVT